MWSECHKKLEESLQMALNYQDTMQVCGNAVDSSLVFTSLLTHKVLCVTVCVAHRGFLNG